MVKLEKPFMQSTLAPNYSTSLLLSMYLCEYINIVFTQNNKWATFDTILAFKQ